MQRHLETLRANWQEKVEKLGFIFHTNDDSPYWDESACYEFSASEIARIERAGNELHQMCLKAVDFVIEHNRFAQLGITPQTAEFIRKAWDDEPPTLYGRFDFGYNGSGDPKLFEYNADTPTTLLEAAVVQWHWLQDRYPNSDQFNFIWECLLDQWKWILENRKLRSNTVHFAYQDHWEDIMTVGVLSDTANQCGINVIGLEMESIGWDREREQFVDLKNELIENLFKLYPWEFLFQDEFGRHVCSSIKDTHWIEPIWKMVLSNKAILAILWEMFPDHPYLLPAYLDGPHDMAEYVSKPILGREGGNVTIVRHGDRQEFEGPYGQSRQVYQGFFDQRTFDGNRPVLGVWVVGETACGMGIRETRDVVTDNFARFVPHRFES